MKISVVITYYNQPEVLEWCLGYICNWLGSTIANTEVIIVDDGSKEHPAFPVVRRIERKFFKTHWFQIYKVVPDIPWNQCGARNLGASVAKHEWLLMLDVDHTVDCTEMDTILNTTHQTRTKRWFTFDRLNINTEQPLHPAKNIFLMTKKDFNRVGGYDEDLTGQYLQDRLFIHQATKTLGSSAVFPGADVYVKSDGFVRGLKRDSERNRQLIADKIAGRIPMSRDMVRFEWEKLK